MLHKETVERKTFELLKAIMQDENLENFHLAGGTALALYLGYRKSIDLDLFSNVSFDAFAISNYLVDNYNFKESYRESDTLKGHIDNIKIDCIAHVYPIVEPIEQIDDIRLYSIKDIVAMKLNAIADNGTRLKDFVDVASLSTKMSLIEMLNAYQQKYENINAIRALRGLVYHEDIIMDEPIEIISGKYKWKLIEKRINEMVKKDTTTFDSLPFE